MSSHVSDQDLRSAAHKTAASTGDGDQYLDLINKVQMFQIAVSKINHNLVARKKDPIFTLGKEINFKAPSTTSLK